MILKFLSKLSSLRRVHLKSEGSFIIIDRKTNLNLKKGSRILINEGVFKAGGALPGCIEIPSLNKTQITLEENATLIIDGDVNIASGTFIHVKKNATLKFGGGNFIGHNNIIICSRDTNLGRNTSTSWNVTLIDHDGHKLYFPNGNALKKPSRPMNIEENVGIQMNVTIPTGVEIGKNCLIGANSVIRKNIPKDTFVYSTSELRSKNGISAGLQFVT